METLEILGFFFAALIVGVSLSVRSSPSVRQRRRDRSRTHRSLWPSHPASECPRCLRIPSRAEKHRETERVKPKLKNPKLMSGQEQPAEEVTLMTSASSYHQEGRRTTGVLWETGQKHWRFSEVGTQTHKNWKKFSTSASDVTATLLFFSSVRFM